MQGRARGRRLGRMQTATDSARREKRASRTRADWITEVKRWRDSGQKCGQYARAHDLHPGTLSYWASRLRHEAGPKSPATKRTKRFAPLRVIKGGAVEEPKTKLPTTSGEFEVVLSIGRAVRVTGSFQPDTLSRLLAIVEGMKSC
jgi:hypothetical protein